MKKKIIDVLKIVLFFGVGFTILYLVYQNQNSAYQEQCALDGIPADQCSLVDKVWQDLKSVKVGWLLIVMLCFNISNVSRAMRWKMMLESMGYKIKLHNAFFTIMLSYFANLGLPRVGEVLRATTFSQYEKIRVDKLMGTIVLDRLLDLLSVGLIVVAAIALQYDILWGFISEQLGERSFNSSALIFIAVIGFVLLLLGYVFRNWLGQIKIVQRIRQLLLGFVSGLSSVRGIKKPLPFIFHSAVIWGMYFLMTYLCFFAFEPTSSLGPMAGLIVFVFGTFGVIVPSPGGMGTFHALAVIGLSLYGVKGDDAFSFANILFFSVQIGCSILLGIIALIALPILNRGYVPDHSQVIKS